MDSGSAVQLNNNTVAGETHIGESVVIPKNEEESQPANGLGPANANKSSDHVVKSEGLDSSGMDIEPSANASRKKLSKGLKVSYQL